MKRQLYLLVALVLTVSLLLAACAKPAPSPTPKPPPAGTTPPTAAPAPKASPTPPAPAAGTPQYGGVLKVATGASPRSLAAVNNRIRNWFQQPPYDTLLKLDEKGELQPNLATSWKFSPDFKSITLTLRKGVKFHDGTDFNAAAAKFNFEIRKAAKMGDYEEVESISIIDDSTVQLNLSKFNNTLLSAFWFIGGMMHSPAAFQKDGKDQALWNPVGTGPFKFVKYNPNVDVRFERFDGYWEKGKPYLDGFHHVIIADATTRELALRKGEVHAIESVGGNVALALQKEGWPVLIGPPETYSGFAPDSANPESPLANKKVREAVEYAIDRPAIAKSLGYGFMVPLNQMAPPGTYPYDPTLKGREFNPAKAKQLLAEAGYPNGFKMTFLTIFSIADALVAAQTYLKEVGIDGTIDVADSGRYYSLTLSSGWKTGFAYRAPRMLPDWLTYANAELSDPSVDLKSTWRPADLKGLFDKTLTAPDAASKKAAAQQVVRKISEEAVWIPLTAGNYIVAHNKNAHNIEYYVPWGPNKLWGPTEVWLSK
ncbi:MAG: ABC transporter substrate-binding protein [Chloroflexi bacterium]|nr:ABC transporter substrate-binding protein [Chloroflexota bacterium]